MCPDMVSRPGDSGSLQNDSYCAQNHSINIFTLLQYLKGTTLCPQLRRVSQGSPQPLRGQFSMSLCLLRQGLEQCPHKFKHMSLPGMPCSDSGLGEGSSSAFLTGPRCCPCCQPRRWQSPGLHCSMIWTFLCQVSLQ